MSTNEDRITVIADDRERKSEVIQFLSDMKNISVAIKRLSLGDYLVDIRTGKVLEGKANDVIILDHFVLLITTCYHNYFLGSTTAAATIYRDIFARNKPRVSRFEY
jgi:hypothetical protein